MAIYWCVLMVGVLLGGPRSRRGAAAAMVDGQCNLFFILCVLAYVVYGC